MISLLNACKMALAWFDKMTNDESVWEEQSSADMATIMAEAITETKHDTFTELQHSREPEKVWVCPRCGYGNVASNEVCMGAEMGEGRGFA